MRVYVQILIFQGGKNHKANICDNIMTLLYQGLPIYLSTSRKDILDTVNIYINVEPIQCRESAQISKSN